MRKGRGDWCRCQLIPFRDSHDRGIDDGGAGQQEGGRSPDGTKRQLEAVYFGDDHYCSKHDVLQRSPMFSPHNAQAGHAWLDERRLRGGPES